MRGWLEFQYKEGPRTGEKFKALINTFTLDVDPATALLPNPFYESWMNY